jgi:CRP-like cAMP-binding protein
MKRQSKLSFGKLLVIAAVLSIIGQLTALWYGFTSTPYATVTFMALGIPLLLLAMAIFGWVVFKDAKERADSVSERSYVAGEYIFKQGQPSDNVYVIKSGEVEIVKKEGEGEAVLARLREGEYFGEMGLIGGRPRNAGARAATKVIVLSIGRYDFENLFVSVPAFRKSIEGVVQHRA